MPISWFFVSFHSFSFIYLGSSDPLVYGGDCRYLGLYLWGRWLWLRFSVTTCSSMFQYLPVASIYVWDIRPLTFSRSYYFLDTASVADFSCISRGRHIMVPLTRFSTLFLHARARIYPHHSGTYTSRIMAFQRSLSSSSVFRNVYVCSWVQFRFQPTQDLIDSKFC